MTEELKLLSSSNSNSNDIKNKRSDYASIAYSAKSITSSNIDHGQERLNQLGYKQVMKQNEKVFFTAIRN